MDDVGQGGVNQVGTVIWVYIVKFKWNYGKLELAHFFLTRAREWGPELRAQEGRGVESAPAN